MKLGKTTTVHRKQSSRCHCTLNMVIKSDEFFKQSLKNLIAYCNVKKMYISMEFSNNTTEET